MRHALWMICLLVAGCSGPFIWLPGGQLSGAEAPLDVSAVADDVALLQLETNPSDPYSVNLGFQRIDGQIYIDPAPERQWYQHIQANPQVRIRFDGSDVVHPALAQPVSDPAVLSQFEPDRVVLRLVPRS